MNQTKRGESERRQPLGHVLVATDFSRGAAHAVARAARLPITPGSAITILHVLPGEAEAGAEAMVRRPLDQAAGAARKAAREAGLTDVDVFTHIAHGKPFVEIIASARHTGAGLAGGIATPRRKRQPRSWY